MNLCRYVYHVIYFIQYTGIESLLLIRKDERWQFIFDNQKVSYWIQLKTVKRFLERLLESRLKVMKNFRKILMLKIVIEHVGGGLEGAWHLFDQSGYDCFRVRGMPL